MTGRMTHSGYSCDRYTIVRAAGMVRHSNLDIIDARNSLALRYGLYAVLIEGRRVSSNDPSVSLRSVDAIREAIQAAVDWAQQNSRLISLHRAALNEKRSSIPVACQYDAAGLRVRRMQMQSATTGEVQCHDLPGEYFSLIRVTKKIDPPAAYAIDRNASPLLQVLKRQGFTPMPSRSLSDATIDIYEVMGNPIAPENEDVPQPPRLISRRAFINSDHYAVFNFGQSGVSALCLFLDPASQFAAHRFIELQMNIRSGATYPIARIEKA
jgi:hypothetical protein